MINSSNLRTRKTIQLDFQSLQDKNKTYFFLVAHVLDNMVSY